VADKLVKVRVFDARGQLVGPIDLPRVEKSDAEWRQQLTREQYEVARGKGTERPFCGTLLDNKRQGVYTCVCCKLPLFTSDSKFNSGTGWPSFFQPIAAENVVNEEDRTYGMRRVEILCTRCDAHLGHVFEDGPRPTGLRYCVNSESLNFTDSSEVASLAEHESQGDQEKSQGDQGDQGDITGRSGRSGRSGR
jgi:methionine-R-sulfoxide reductase